MDLAGVSKKGAWHLLMQVKLNCFSSILVLRSDDIGYAHAKIEKGA